MKPEAILFDLDGTVLDTLDDLVESVNFGISVNGFPKREKAYIRRILGNGPRDLIRRALPESASDAEFEKCLESFKDHYETNKTNTTAPYDGIIPLLKKLKERGYKLAVVSNKHDDALYELNDLYFPGYFDFATGSCDTVPKKPDPTMVELALEKLGAAKENAIYVGDSEVDVQTAKNSNLPCIAVTWGFRDEDVLIEAGAETLVNTADELFDTIINM